jgi:hypothetical protein
MNLIENDAVRALLLVERIAFAAVLALFIGVLFYLLRRDNGS